MLEVFKNEGIPIQMLWIVCDASCSWERRSMGWAWSLRLPTGEQENGEHAHRSRLLAEGWGYNINSNWSPTCAEMASLMQAFLGAKLLLKRKNIQVDTLVAFNDNFRCVEAALAGAEPGSDDVQTFPHQIHFDGVA